MQGHHQVRQHEEKGEQQLLPELCQGLFWMVVMVNGEENSLEKKGKESRSVDVELSSGLS